MALIPPQYLDAVVSIGVKNSVNEYIWIGTGFLIGTPNGKKNDMGGDLYFPFLVTNKHVLKDQKEVFLRFNPQSNEDSKDYPLPLVDDKNKILWTGHPSDDIDIAVIAINFQLLQKDQMKCYFFESDKQVLTKKQMIESGIGEGDFIYVCGFPMNLVDKTRKYVIVRTGIIARIKNYLDGYSKDFLVDSFVFPGNSGGPVINKAEMIGVENTKILTKCCLLGMVQSYITYKDIAISQQTKEPRMIFVENSGLASVIPAEFILETIEIAIPKVNQ
jgi:S1-C subfamily serine protease